MSDELEVVGQATVPETAPEPTPPSSEAQAIDEARIQQLVNEGIERGLSQMQAQQEALITERLNALAQSMSDRQTNRLMKAIQPQLQAIDTIGKRVGWDDNQILQQKMAAIADGYASEQKDETPGHNVPAQPPQTQPQAAAATVPNEHVWTRDELENWVSQAYGLTSEDFDVGRWAGYRQDDPRGKGLAQAAKTAAIAKANKLQSTATAKSVKQTQTGFGSTGAVQPSGSGQPPSREQMEARLKVLLDADPPSNPKLRKAYEAEVDDLYAKVYPNG